MTQHLKKASYAIMRENLHAEGSRPALLSTQENRLLSTKRQIYQTVHRACTENWEEIMRQNILPKQLYAAISKLKCKETDICMSGEASAPPLPSSRHSSPPPPPLTLKDS